jgi:hypothetical protein
MPCNKPDQEPMPHAFNLGRWLRGRRLILGWLLTLTAHSASAGMQEIIDALTASDFRFTRSSSDVPFVPLGWAQTRYYPNSQFTGSGLPGASVTENTSSLGGGLPPYIGTRDLLLVGGDVTWDRITVKSGPYADQSVLLLTPVAGWAHQLDEADVIGAFVAPIFSKELLNDGSWGINGYGGVVGMHWFSDTFQLLYGGVYQYNFGQSTGYPYAGVMWNPTPQLSFAIVFPWPTISYVPADRWLLQLGLSPGGSSWVKRGSDYESTESLSSWNLTANVGYRFYEKLWLMAGAGITGLREIEISTGDSTSRLEAKPSAVFSLAVQFRF